MLQGEAITLRALEPEDLELLYKWENETKSWPSSGTTAPFSRHQLAEYITAQSMGDIYSTRQLRLIIELPDGQAAGAVDLFDIDITHQRAGVGIIVDPEKRGQRIGISALKALINYANQILRLHQLWADVACSNRASLALFKSAGFSQTATKREWIRGNNGFEDQATLQLLLHKTTH
ncbi:MAG: GNAT family protein [Rikenellaceae bacterium]